MKTKKCIEFSLVFLPFLLGFYTDFLSVGWSVEAAVVRVGRGRSTKSLNQNQTHPHEVFQLQEDEGKEGYVCTEEGSFPVAGNCSNYHYCLLVDEGEGTFLYLLVPCSDGQHYCTKIDECTPDPSCPCEGGESLTTSTISSSSSSVVMSTSASTGSGSGTSNAGEQTTMTIQVDSPQTPTATESESAATTSTVVSSESTPSTLAQESSFTSVSTGHSSIKSSPSSALASASISTSTLTPTSEHTSGQTKTQTQTQTESSTSREKIATVQEQKTSAVTATSSASSLLFEISEQTSTEDIGIESSNGTTDDAVAQTTTTESMVDQTTTTETENKVIIIDELPSSTTKTETMETAPGASHRFHAPHHLILVCLVIVSTFWL